MSATLRLQPVDPERRADVRRFTGLPSALYRDSAQWVPPVRADARLALDRRRHPFYQHSEAAFFLVEEGKETLGRIAVADHRNYNAYHGTRTAFFWCFEAVDDPAVARLLLDGAAEWAAGRGLDLLVGPKGPLLGDGIGLLIEGFEHRPALGVAYNPPYYPALVEGAGFEKDTDFLTGRLLRHHHLPEAFFAAADEAGAARGYRAFAFSSRRQIRRWLPRFTAVYNEAFRPTWEYTPLTEDEVRSAVERLLPVIEPNLIRLVMQGDDIVGLPDRLPRHLRSLAADRGPPVALRLGEPCCGSGAAPGGPTSTAWASSPPIREPAPTRSSTPPWPAASAGFASRVPTSSRWTNGTPP